MPLKPIFHRAPFLPLPRVALRPGQVRLNDPALAALVQPVLTALPGTPCLWAPAVGLWGVLPPTAETAQLKQQAEAAVSAALALQQPDGRFDQPAADIVATLRAALTLYQAQPEAKWLNPIAGWLTWLLKGGMDEVLAALGETPAELMALLTDYYLITGKSAVLRLCSQLRDNAMDWAAVLRTFAAVMPLEATMGEDQLAQGLRSPNAQEAAYYRRQRLIHHGEALADGARYAALSGQYSGSGVETAAPKAGWERIRKSHGAVCGGVTADPLLAGQGTNAPVDTAALGAWTEALAATGLATGETWAFDQLTRLMRNALPAAVAEGKVLAVQRVNQLTDDGAEADAAALSRLVRGYVAGAAAAVCMTKDGLAVESLLPGSFALPFGGAVCRMQLSAAVEGYQLKLQLNQPAEATLTLRIPPWAETFTLAVNGETVKAAVKDGRITLRRAWQGGEEISLSLPQRLRLEEGHHQSLSAWQGDTLLCWVPQEDWPVAVLGRGAENGLRLAVCPAWRQRKDIPLDVPVLPDTQGEAFEAALTSYAEAQRRIAAFPKGKRA